MNAIYRVNSELAGIVHLWGDDPLNAEIPKALRDKLPLLLLIPPQGKRFGFLEEKGLKKGDPIVVTLNGSEIISVKLHSDGVLIWERVKEMP